MTEPQTPAKAGAEYLSLDDFRDRLATRLLYVLLGVGLLAFAGSLTRALDTGWRPLLWLHIGLYLILLIAVLLAARLSSIARRWLLLGILLVLGIAGIAVYGLLGLGPVALVVFCTLTSALLGMRAGLVVTVASALAIALVGVLAVTGHHRFGVDPVAYLYSATSWINAVTGTLLAAVLAVTATGFLLRSLETRNNARLRSAEVLDSITRNSPDILLLLDTTGKFVYLSHTETGYHDPAELLGQRMADFAIPEDRDRLQAAIDQAVTTGSKRRVEANYRDPSGQPHPYDIHLAPVMRDGRVTALSVIARDIDEQRTTEMALRSERNFNTAMLGTIGAIIVVLDPQGCIIDFNHACESISGYAKHEVLGRKVWDFLLASEERNGVQDVFSHLTAGHFPNAHVNDWVTRDGARRRIAWSNTVLTDTNGAITHVIATGIDISRLVQTEAALIRSEERLRLSQWYAGIGTWDWDITTGTLYWSEEIGLLFGYGEAVPETTYENFLGAIHPDDRQQVIDAVHACIERDVPYDIEHRVVWPDGSVRWLLERGGTTRGTRGEPLHMLGIVQDITERKQAAKSLAESEALFREFAENTDDVFWVRDLRSNRMIYANPAYGKIWGRSCAALLANPLDFLDTVHPDDLDSVREGMLRQQRGEYFNRNYRIIRTDGQIRWVHVQAFPIRNSAGVVYRIGGLARDITRQQQLEADRLRHERAQLQTLVREVHHRIKNHLQGVVGLLDEHVSRFPATASLFTKAISQIRSIALAHGLQGQGTDVVLHLCEVVPAVAQSVAATLGTPAAIETRIDMDWSLRIADADTVPLALIFNELLINCLKHRPPDSRSYPVRLHLYEQQGIGHLTFTCPGARLPEPFDFEHGVGLGTGLELVRSLLPREGATLTFRNNPDGVCCEMTLQAPVVFLGSRAPGNAC